MIKLTDNSSIYVACPAGIATGGPLALHQLAHQMRKLSINANMYYFNIPESGKLVHDNYTEFEIPYTTEVDDKADNVLIVPEALTEQLFSFQYIRKAIWWLSVDNYYNTYEQLSKKNKLLYIIGMKKRFEFKDKDYFYHFAQSKYAYDFLINRKISEDKIYYLTDYIDDKFTQIANEIDLSTKKDNVLYNPKKGFDFTKKLIDNSPKLNWIPIQNMAPLEVRDLFLNSKLYIDFGEHPGRDRFPREAALCRCGVITNKSGSAGNEVDVPILHKYKYDSDDSNIKYIINDIEAFLENFESNIKDFDSYVKFIKTNKEVFIKEIEMIFN